MELTNPPRVVLLAGGVGGAKLSQGFYELYYGPQALWPREKAQDRLQIFVNVGDDWEWMGLKVCPDWDTNLYTLAQVNNKEQGWGLEGDTFKVLEALSQFPQAPTWFQMGDRDLALSLQRSAWLQEGLSLSQVARRLAELFQLVPCLHPASDSPTPTWIDTERGLLPFQEYLVRYKAKLRAYSFQYRQVEGARPHPQLLGALAQAQLLVIAPSNPLVSILPILALPGVRDQIEASAAHKVAVSPVVRNKAFKGPLLKMLHEAGRLPDATGVARYYRPWLETFCLDPSDSDLEPALSASGLKTYWTSVDLKTLAQRRQLAFSILTLPHPRSATPCPAN